MASNFRADYGLLKIVSRHLRAILLFILCIRSSWGSDEEGLYTSVKSGDCRIL